MEIRHPMHPDGAKALDTQGLRNEFLLAGLFSAGEVKLVYSLFDRIIVGGAVPVEATLSLQADKGLTGSDSLLDSRELGILNLGGTGSVSVDGRPYALGRMDALYVGRGSRSVELTSATPSEPAKFYLLSGLAHASHPTSLVGRDSARRVKMGSPEESNARTINQVIHPDVIKSCNLCMGYTVLEPGSVWNTMPCHTHLRRMEVYLYFDMTEGSVVFHMMGTPRETRHIVLRNEEGVISPSWSIHSGVGTSRYSFVWGMVGENQTFTDMDAVPMDALR